MTKETTQSKRVYMDNSATSFPKPKTVINSMVEYMIQSGTSISRSTSIQAKSTGDKIFTLRETLADFFNAPDSRNVIFTKNITEALNIVIKGLIRRNDIVMISSLEHNAVTRPLVQQGAKIIPIPVSERGETDLSFAKEHIPLVKAVFCTHVSNVSGDVVPIESLAEMCCKKNIPFILDTAQSAGLLPIDMTKTPIDCLCFTGHKSLLGPTGTGGMIISSELAKKIPPLITGGTGSKSHEEIHPNLTPDKYEAGTPNIVGLIGLLEGIRSIIEMGMEERLKIETALGEEFFEMLSSLKGIEIIGSKEYSRKPPVFSLNFSDMDNSDVSFALSEYYHIDNRCGLHCAPRAHLTYKTFPKGTVRLSLSHFTTREELQYAFFAIREILKHGMNFK